VQNLHQFYCQEIVRCHRIIQPADCGGFSLDGYGSVCGRKHFILNIIAVRLILKAIRIVFYNNGILKAQYGGYNFKK
jgi:hypothetical protein